MDQTFFCRCCGNSGFIQTGDIYACSNCGVTFTNPAQFSLPIIKMKRLTENAYDVIKGYDTDTGYDISSAYEYVIKPGETKLIKTDVAFEFPYNVGCQVRARSGLAKKGYIIANGPGTIDQSYRNGVGVLIYNSTNSDFNINPGDRIAQLVFEFVIQPQIQEVDVVNETDRNLNGFGSTGTSVNK
jgi:dUTP pyrophosphatase